MRLVLFCCVHCSRRLNEELDELCPDHPHGPREHVELFFADEVTPDELS
jgi:hypothetical protein